MINTSDDIINDQLVTNQDSYLIIVSGLCQRRAWYSSAWMKLPADINKSSLRGRDVSDGWVTEERRRLTFVPRNNGRV